MTAVIFRTPGDIDVRAFTTMGVNAKPMTDRPIGYFGTGLKYAIAVLGRLGAVVTVHTGGVRYWFETRPMDFRGTEFQQIVMRRDTWSGGEGWRLGRAQKLPYTTIYGRNWLPWMAFRELYSNTLDEGGHAYEEPEVDFGSYLLSELQESTCIIVSGCEEFTEAFRDRSATFLSLDERTVEHTLPGLEVREGPTQRLYYQGMRAKDVGKPTLHTYNWTHGADLTEDRQLAHEWQVRFKLANTLATHCTDEALIEQIITAGPEVWEHGLEPEAWVSPGAAFRRVMARRPRGVGGSWGGWYGRHDDRPEVGRVDLWYDALRPWRVDGGDVLAADGVPLFSKPYRMNEVQWAKLAVTLVAKANEDTRDPVGLYEPPRCSEPERVQSREEEDEDDTEA